MIIIIYIPIHHVSDSEHTMSQAIATLDYHCSQESPNNISVLHAPHWLVYHCNAMSFGKREEVFKLWTQPRIQFDSRIQLYFHHHLSRGKPFLWDINLHKISYTGNSLQTPCINGFLLHRRSNTISTHFAVLVICTLSVISYRPCTMFVSLGQHMRKPLNCDQGDLVEVKKSR